MGGSDSKSWSSSPVRPDPSRCAEPFNGKGPATWQFGIDQQTPVRPMPGAHDYSIFVSGAADDPLPQVANERDPPKQKVIPNSAPRGLPGSERTSPGGGVGKDIQYSLQKTASTNKPNSPAHVWHAVRRGQLLQREGVRELIRVAGGARWTEAFVTSSVAAGVIAIHAASALAIKRLAASSTTPHWVPSLVVAGAAASVGAQCAFVLQALNHELSHAVPATCSDGAIGRVTHVSLLTLGVGGAALCHVPWAAYYFSGSHQRHHCFAGSRRDVDADALFFLWQTPLRSTFARFCWLSFAAVVAPLSYAASLLKYSMVDLRANIPEIRLMALDWTLTTLACRHAGRYGGAYLLLSSFFSMGFLAHPLVGFWILQHLCVGGKQPTVSYYGSDIWNILCLNELYHVEHHDFAGLSWRTLPKLRSLAPDLYDELHAESSIWSLIFAWLRGHDPRFAWDFACRERWGFGPRYMPGICGPTPTTTSATPARNQPSSEFTGPRFVPRPLVVQLPSPSPMPPPMRD